jgi:predicted nucleic acid-binding protein
MKALFGDAFFWLALVNADDEAHDFATEYLAACDEVIVTTDPILLEVGDALSSTPRGRESYLSLVSDLRKDPSVKIIPFTQEAFSAALTLYGSRRDKQWSLTDCCSFVVMEELRIHEALTGDRHFEQAGFTAVFR